MANIVVHRHLHVHFPVEELTTCNLILRTTVVSFDPEISTFLLTETDTTNPYSRGSDPFETRRPSKKTRSFVFAGHLPQDTTRPEARGSSKRTPSLPSEDGTLVKPLSTLSMDDEHALGTSSRPKSPSSVSSGLSDGEEVLFAGRNPRAIHNNAQSEGRVTTHLSSKRAITLTKSSEPIKPSLSTPKPQDPKIKRSLNSHVDPLATAFTPPGDGKSSYQYASPIDSPYVSTSDSRPSQPPNRKPLAGDLHLNSAGNRSDRIFNFDVLGRRVPAGRSETSFPKRQRQVDSHVVPPHLRGLATFKASVDSNDVTENGTRPGDPPTSENLRTVSLKEQKRTKAKVSAKQQDPLHESRSASGIDELLEGEETDTNASLNTEDQAALDLEDAFACSLNRDTSNVSAVMEQRGYMHIQLEEGDSAEASKAADREMLISGDAFNDEYDTDYLRQAAIQFKAKSRGKGRLHGSARPTSGLDALEHDDYADFDIMDRERASIKRTSKSQPPFDLSDSELEDDILLAWENDRTRKKFKKQQREARLANDSQADGTDLRAKYPNGMVLKDVKEEIQLFLGSNRNQ